MALAGAWLVSGLSVAAEALGKLAPCLKISYPTELILLSRMRSPAQELFDDFGYHLSLSDRVYFASENKVAWISILLIRWSIFWFLK